MQLKFFSTAAKFRDWLDKNHLKEKELWVGYYKVGTGRPSISWPESVEQALCYGWIDGIRKSIDAESYKIRFTPRRAQSKWSKVNIQKVEELSKAGLMNPAGIEAFEKRNKANYSFEQEEISLNNEYIQIFKANPKAWSYYQSQTHYYRKATTQWIMSAKLEQTRLKRLNQLIIDSEEERYIKEMKRPG